MSSDDLEPAPDLPDRPVVLDEPSAPVAPEAVAAEAAEDAAGSGAELGRAADQHDDGVGERLVGERTDGPAAEPGDPAAGDAVAELDAHPWRSLGRALLHRASAIVRPSPDGPRDDKPADEEVTQRYARTVIDLCLRVGEAMLASGAPSVDVVAAVLKLSHRYGLTGTHVEISFTSITISWHRGIDQDPISVMRVIRVRATDYTRLEGIYALVDDATRLRDPLAVDEARERLALVLKQPHPYRRLVVTAGKAILAAGAAAMFEVSIVLVLVAAVAAILSDVVTWWLERWEIPPFFAQIAAAAITTGIAVFMYWLQSVGISLPGADEPTVIVISGIVLLLSGVGLTTAAGDAIDGYYVTAAARGFEVVMLTLGLAVGISITLSVALRFGAPVYVGMSLGDSAGLLAGLIGAACVGLGFALTSYVRLRRAPLTALVAAFVYGVYYMIPTLSSPPGVTAGLAGVVAGILGYLIHRWLKIPEAAMTMAGIIALIPGLAVYRALYSLMTTESAVAATPHVIAAVGTGVGLAAGTSVGVQIAQRIVGRDWAAVLATRQPDPGGKDAVELPPVPDDGPLD